MFSNKHYKRWFLQGASGVVLLGMGLCMLLESAFFKHSHPPAWQWIGAGTLSLCVVMAGLMLVIDSVKHRIYYEQSKDASDSNS
ncbi:MAG: hypothetical protein AAFV95_13865 [Bacteroidota bacterium]